MNDVRMFTTIGFFSVAQADGFLGAPPDKTLMIRARDAEDLDRLRDAFIPGLGETVKAPGRDYPVRAFTTHHEFADGLAKMALAIDYGKFKNAVADRQGPTRPKVYGKVWKDCLAIEEGSSAT